MAEWALRYRVPLLKYFSKRGYRTDGEDFVQEVFLRLAHRADIHNIEHVNQYVWNTAASVIRDHYRRDSVRAVGKHEPLDDLLEAGFTPERILLGEEAVRRLIDALMELPQVRRDTFALYHLADYSHAQIGEKLGIAVSTVEKHMARANKHLLKRLNNP